MSFYKEVPGRQTTLESTLKFDTEPKAGSTNPVTSDGVNTAITEAVGGASDALQEQIDDIAEKAGSGYIPKGEATVATLNGLSGQENGWLYTMTDAGTLTDGSLAVTAGDSVAWDEANSVWYKAMDYAPRQYGTNEVHNLATTITDFRTGDVIPVDGPDGTAKMSKDDLLKETEENAANSGLMPKNETDTNFDFSIVDGQGNAIIIIKDGEVITQNFDSSLIKREESKDGQQYFEVCDTNWNCIFAVSTDGTILSKNFDSSKITYVKDDTDGFRIVDYKGNCVLSVNGGNLVSANFDSRMNDYKRSPNYGKSIATFGGSHSVYPESYGMKEYWKALLGMSVTDYGVGGNGYSSLQTPDHNVQKQVDGAGVHDIYLLVCSTNDFTYSRAIGEYNDYSFSDGYDSSKLETMCGGINYAIRKIYEKNPNAKICGFLGLPFFTRYAGYNEFSGDVNSLEKNYFDYISAFAKTMNWNHLPVLDLFHNCGFNVHNKSLFYQNDNLHLTFMGYNRLAMMTTDFISKL